MMCLNVLHKLVAGLVWRPFACCFEFVWQQNSGHMPVYIMTHIWSKQLVRTHTQLFSERIIHLPSFIWVVFRCSCDSGPWFKFRTRLGTLFKAVPPDIYKSLFLSLYIYIYIENAHATPPHLDIFWYLGAMGEGRVLYFAFVFWIWQWLGIFLGVHAGVFLECANYFLGRGHVDV